LDTFLKLQFTKCDKDLYGTVFWLKEETKSKFPNLSQIALKKLCGAPTSSIIEQRFSLCGIAMSKLRSKTLPHNKQ
jgi:hypothetical protein